MFKFQTLIAATLIAASATAAAAAPVVNGSFEDIGNVSLNNNGWSFFGSIPGWTATPKGEVQSAPTIGQVDAQDGQYYVELDSNQNATLSQTIFLTPGRYELSFFYSPRVNDPSQGTNDMTYALGNLLSGSVNGAPNGAYPYKTWTEVVEEFTVQSGDNYILSLAGAGAQNEKNGCGDCGALIDNVSISPVPLPASFLLLLGGVGGLGAVRARRRSAATTH